jgi:hypothetical protein
MLSHIARLRVASRIVYCFGSLKIALGFTFLAGILLPAAPVFAQTCPQSTPGSATVKCGRMNTTL